MPRALSLNPRIQDHPIHTHKKAGPFYTSSKFIINNNNKKTQFNTLNSKTMRLIKNAFFSPGLPKKMRESHTVEVLREHFRPTSYYITGS